MKFEGEFAFLSNFFPAEVSLGKVVFPTVEHAYQAAKTWDSGCRDIIRRASTPGKAKRIGATVPIRSDWEEIKVSVMRGLLLQKFSRPELVEKLRGIEGSIVEDNTWGDTFWGVCNGDGENHLGKLLVEIRDDV